MRHEHIGTLDGQILLFGGPYSNAQATAALFRQAKQLEIAGKNLICTGDVVAYCGAPEATIKMVQDARCTVVAGNCEIQLANSAPDCGCGFEDGTVCDVLSAGWYSFASATLSPSEREWMGQAPDIITFDHNGERYAVLHGGQTDVSRFIWETSDGSVFDQEWRAVEAAVGAVQHIVAGHCGMPFVRDLPQGRWINAGVIGMPPHDAKPDTRYALLEAGKVSICTLEYDVAGAVADMQRAGLNQGYEKSLISGIWPSEDILPQELRLSVLVSG